MTDTIDITSLRHMDRVTFTLTGEVAWSPELTDERVTVKVGADFLIVRPENIKRVTLAIQRVGAQLSVSGKGPYEVVLHDRQTATYCLRAPGDAGLITMRDDNEALDRWAAEQVRDFAAVMEEDPGLPASNADSSPGIFDKAWPMHSTIASEEERQAVIDDLKAQAGPGDEVQF